MKDCPFVIKVIPIQDRQKLYVKEVSGDHTHELSEVKMIFYATNLAVYCQTCTYISYGKYFAIIMLKHLDSKANEEAVEFPMREHLL